MVTMLEECAIEEQLLLCFFCGQKNIHREIFSVYCWKCLSPKSVHNWVEKFSRGRWKVVDEARQGVEVAETTVRKFCPAGFQSLVKRWDKCINVGGGYVEK
jgi:hypothetical protein